MDNEEYFKKVIEEEFKRLGVKEPNKERVERIYGFLMGLLFYNSEDGSM